MWLRRSRQGPQPGSMEVSRPGPNSHTAVPERCVSAREWRDNGHRYGPEVRHCPRSRLFRVRQGKVGAFCLEAESPEHGTRIATTIASARIPADHAVEAATKTLCDFVKKDVPTLL